MEYLILRIFEVYFIWNICLTPYKIEKTFQIMTSVSTPTRFQFFNEKLYFCPHIAESANIVENAISSNYFASEFPNLGKLHL